MNNKAIERYAKEARLKLIEQIKQKAYQYGITEKEIKEPEVSSENEQVINGITLDITKKKQRDDFIKKIDKDNYKTSYTQLIEEVAYTWFNRITAIKYLEVNDYLDHGIRVLSSTEKEKKTPDIIEKALRMDLDIEEGTYYNLIDKKSDNDIFRVLLIKQCNKLHEKLPFMFEKRQDYTELLLPDNLLDEDSVINKLNNIEEQDFNDVEVIGWLYQYYISDLKDKNIKKKKYKKEDIPSVTQLFTPHWIVQYMVQNSLGKLWLESKEEDNRQQKLKENWEYYLEPAEQTEEVKQKLKEITNKDLKPEEITFLDPACGSGHILVYAFDILYEIYKNNGYNPKVIVKNILEKNLYGLDIDKRAVQLAKFALMMRARQKDRKILDKKIKLNVLQVQKYQRPKYLKDIIENVIDKTKVDYDKDKLKETYKYLVETYENADELGSLIKVGEKDYKKIYEETKEIGQKSTIEDITYLLPLIRQADIMAKKYDVVVTNPPYAGNKFLDNCLKEYINKYYIDTKGDLYSVFIGLCLDKVRKNGYISMITIHTWMFIKSFENLRHKILTETNIDSMMHTGAATFTELRAFNVLSTCFIFKNSQIKNYIGKYVRLADYYSSEDKIDNFSNEENYYYKNQGIYNKIPQYPIIYWISNKQLKVFVKQKSLKEIATPRQGMATANNEYFLRSWHEVYFNKIGFNFKKSIDTIKTNYKWFPYNKGGNFRKWFGNNEFIVNWENDGYELKKFKRSALRNKDFYFKEGITWSLFGFENFSVRYKSFGFLFDVSGSSIFPPKEKLNYILGFLASKVSFSFLSILAPTVNFQIGNIGDLPINFNNEKKQIIDKIVEENINLSKKDWDSFETSWDFEKHPLVKFKDDVDTVKEAFENWSDIAKSQFNQLWENEEELNRIFIEIYGLEDELTPDVDKKDVTVRKANKKRDIKSFISYGVGCILGRYSLDEDGLAYAGGNFDSSKYETLIPDDDGIVTILDKDYFENDIVKRFVEFVEKTFGHEKLEVNLEYIASALSPRNGEQPRDTLRRYFETGSKFYNDHCKTYNKRPIYWKVSSGGRDPAFMAVIYLHRYNEDTLSTLRIKYLHKLQQMLKGEKEHLRNMITKGLASSDEAKYKARISDIDSKLEELVKFDEKLGHLADQRIKLDLDDGVKENYKKLEEILDSIR
jgi:type II restriction/modification system DNA methylase subunit YeeA